MKEKKEFHFPFIVIILDGWGIDKPNKGNAVALAKTRIMNELFNKYPSTTLCAHGKCAGLPLRQVGNSEAGHMNIGAGRLVEQDVVRISKSISNGTFFKNPAFIDVLRSAREQKSNIHLMGMLGNEMSPHSDPDHILALASFLEKNNFHNWYLHFFTDGRDSPRYAALRIMEDLKKVLPPHHLATIIGRFYAMDRKKEWSRTKEAYEALVSGRGHLAATPEKAISEAYNRGENDEFIKPSVITYQGRPLPRIKDRDGVIFFNLRSDRARQLTKAFVQEEFNKKNPGSFKRSKFLKNLSFVAMTDFGPDLDSILTAFPSIDLTDTLPMRLVSRRQLYIAETEKYAHVTYFLNGGYDHPVGGEERLLVPSPDVKSYDQTPAMSSAALTEKISGFLRTKKYDFILVNFAAPDMVGHTGNLAAAVECCRQVDNCVGRLVKECLEKEGTALITADHGNIEKMINLETGEVFTEHTTNPVPFILVRKELENRKISFKKGGILADIAPTALNLLGEDKPAKMTGKNLLINYVR